MPETERVKPRGLYVDEAIALALESRWREALAVNQALVEHHGADEAAYNRIGKAQTELGDLTAALDAYKHALEANPLNAIALKNSRKITALLETSATVATSTALVDVDLFTEEPGKSALTKLASPARNVTTAVAPGDVVELDAEGQRIEARTSRGVLLGDIDVKLARRLVGLMEKGNRYTAAVARIADDGIEIMIREEYQSPENASKPSFPTSRTARGVEFRPYAKDSLLADRGIDPESLDAADVDDIGDADDELDEVMQTTDDFDGDATLLAADDDAGDEDVDDEDEDDADEEVRPEDHY